MGRGNERNVSGNYQEWHLEKGIKKIFCKLNCLLCAASVFKTNQYDFQCFLEFAFCLHALLCWSYNIFEILNFHWVSFSLSVIYVSHWHNLSTFYLFLIMSSHHNLINITNYHNILWYPDDYCLTLSMIYNAIDIRRIGLAK